MIVQGFAPVLGGAQRQIEALAPLLARRGATVSVLTRRPPGAPARETRPGLDVRRLGGPSMRAAASAVYTARGTATAMRLGPDVLHAHDLLSPSTIALAAGRATGAPVVAKVLSSGPHGDVRRLLTKPLGARRLRAIRSRFAAFVCVSADVERELAAYGFPPERLRRIPNGVDVARFAPGGDDGAAVRASLGIGAGEPVSLFCGRFAPTKRLDVLVEALAVAPGHLVLAGEGPERDAVRERAAAAGLAGRVHVLATVDDCVPLYRAADAFVTASEQDGLSNAALEAMASGLPVVTTRSGGMPELVGDRAGVLVDAPGGRAFGAALAALLGDESRRRALGAAARERAVRDFSLDATAERLVALYEEVMARR
jgi:glycosyltransferase involved in cell wall biosynthesis